MPVMNQFFAFNKLIQFLGSSWEWAVNGTFRPLYAWEKRLVSFVHEDGPVYGGAENLFLATFRIPFRPGSRDFAILATLLLALIWSIRVCYKWHILTSEQWLWSGFEVQTGEEYVYSLFSVLYRDPAKQHITQINFPPPPTVCSPQRRRTADTWIFQHQGFQE